MRGDVSLKSGAEGFWKTGGDYSDPLPSHLVSLAASRQTGRWGALLLSDPLFCAVLY